MKSCVYIPPSFRTAEKHLANAFKRGARNLTKIEFIRAWGALAYLYPGLHPDGFECEGSGWPPTLKPLASEAWRRAEAGELNDNELYPYQACKARIHREKEEIKRTEPWAFSDHFAV